MLRYMDNRELAIAGIKSLRMVHCYQLVKDNESIPAVMAYYDKDKLINLCVLDEHYDKLLNKVLDIYAREQGSSFMVTDAYTKFVLEGAANTDESCYVKLTDDCSEINNPLYEHRSYMGDIVNPVIRFVINELYGMSGQKLLWNPLNKDWFGTGEMSAMNDEKKIHFPYKITCVREGLYRADVGNILMTGNRMAITVKYGGSGVEIEVKSSLYPVEGRISFVVADNQLTCLADVKIDGKQAYINNEHVALGEVKLSEKMLTRVDKIMPERQCFLLPWGGKMLYRRELKSENGFNEADCMVAYLAETDKSEYMYCLAYKELWSEKHAGYTIYDYAMDMMIDNRIDGHTEVHFCDLGYESRGYYKDNLEGRYYKVN